MEIHFNKNYDSLKNLYQKEELFNSLSGEVSNQISPTALASFKQKYLQYQIELQNLLIEEYYSERSLLLEISILFINYGKID
jgi:hypothetical protein